jgi:peptidoglycan/LPS O-acetylase OafA/YrhL
LQYSVIDVLFSGLLLFFLLAGSAPWGKFAGNRTLRFIGRISYGLYLIHLLVFRLYDKACRRFAPSLLPTDGHFSIVLVRFAVAGGAAILIAYLSRRFFEEPFLRLKDRWRPAMDESVPHVSAHRQDSPSNGDFPQSA